MSLRFFGAVLIVFGCRGFWEPCWPEMTVWRSKVSGLCAPDWT